MDLGYWRSVWLINWQDIARKLTFLLCHSSRHLREPVHMEKSTNQSSCHVQTRPAYQALSANALLLFESTWPCWAECQQTSHYNQLHRNRNTMFLALAQKRFLLRTGCIVSTRLSAASSLLGSFCTNSSKTMFTILRSCCDATTFDLF